MENGELTPLLSFYSVLTPQSSGLIIIVVISFPSFPEYEYAIEAPSFIKGKGLPSTFSQTSFLILGVIDVLKVSLFMALEGRLVSVI
jgi:hypothetical protein